MGLDLSWQNVLIENSGKKKKTFSAPQQEENPPQLYIHHVETPDRFHLSELINISLKPLFFPLLCLLLKDP